MQSNNIRIMRHKCTILRRVAKIGCSIINGTSVFVAEDIVSGATSKADAVVDEYIHISGTPGGGTEAGLLILKDVSGTFIASETISGYDSGSATISGTPAAYTDETGKPFYDYPEVVTDIRCRFYTVSAPYGTVLEQGESPKRSQKVLLPPNIRKPDQTNRITTTEQGFAGLYEIVECIPVNGVVTPIDHYEAVLREVV
jgi:hypothetical protein